jgi:hypothetical protein
MSDQPVMIHISRVHPRATEEELAAIMSAVPSLWPAPQLQRRITDDRAWRFSRRRQLGGALAR